jgi:hypothetical protein
MATLTRRDRCLRIVNSFDDGNRRYHLSVLLACNGLDVLTDGAVEDLARLMMRAHTLQQRLNRENRARRQER